MMLYKLIPPSVVTATIQLPASKSISNRALIITALGKGIYPPEHLSDCDDTQVMIKALTEGKETIDIMLSLIHIFEVMWKHEVVDTFTHDHLKQVKRFDELLLWF